MTALVHKSRIVTFAIQAFLGCVVVVLSVASVCAESVASDSDVAMILAELDVRRDEPRAYSEYRMSTRLREPMKIVGEMVFTSRGDLLKSVTEPFQETITIGETLVRVQRADEVREFSIAKEQGLYDFFRSLRAMLEGDIDTIDELYVVAVERDGDSWTLICKPRHKYLRRYVLEMTMSGTDGEITEIFIDQGRKRWQRLSFAAIDEPGR